MEYWVNLEVQRWSFWMEHLSSVTAPGFSPTTFPPMIVSHGNLLDCRGNFGKRVRLTWKTRPETMDKVASP